MDIRRVKEAREELESRIEKGHNNLVGLLESTLPELLSSLNQSLLILSSFNQRPFEPLSPLSGDSSYRPFKKSKHDPHSAACIEDEEEEDVEEEVDEEIRTRNPKGKHKPVVECVTRSGFLTEEDMVKEVEELLNKKSFKEAALCEAGAEISDLLYRPTSKERAILNKFKTKSGQQVQHYCLALTKEDCRQKSESYTACDKVHFRRIIAPHTDINLGDCSFLDTCRHMKTCKYVHYELDQTLDVQPMMGIVAPPKPLKTLRAEYCSEEELGQSQWISCDIRNFRMDILGQFGVIMADPPWDIHMNLPYGTMEDKEMLNLKVPALQTDGLIFLWVTGRAMELGRECLKEWGYKCVEEIIWVKTNQLQRIIRTGRTGHWLNHSKEHCLIGIKGNPTVNRNIDTDVIVAEVRETSRKPDEMYALLERISPGTRKLELFARMHNTQAGWLSLGNQLDGVRLVDEGLRARYKAAYPDVEVQPTSPPRSPVANASEGKPCSSQDMEMVS